MDLIEKDNQLEQTFTYYKEMGTPLDQPTLIELLREVQDIYDCVPSHIQQRICEEMEVSPAIISIIMKRFPSLKESNYKHRILVCKGSSCRSKNSSELILALEKKLKIKNGETTPDGQFYLNTQYCFKACGKGPNVMIDDTLYHHVTISQLDELLNKYK